MSVGSGGTGRVPAVDLARSAALVGMVIFHGTLDLELFGVLAYGTVASPGWLAFSVLVAGSFVFLSGVSLVLAHADGIRWRAFLRRLAVLVAAAAAVSGATYLAEPETFVRFGILHAIALATTIGLIFLHLPSGITICVAAAVIALPQMVEFEAFDAPWLLWVGLSTTLPAMIDYEPMFPWLGPCLLGIAAARIVDRRALWDALHRAVTAETQLARALAWPGRHSLVVYLVHQPILVGLIWMVLQISR